MVPSISIVFIEYNAIEILKIHMAPSSFRTICLRKCKHPSFAFLTRFWDIPNTSVIVPQILRIPSATQTLYILYQISLSNSDRNSIVIKSKDFFLFLSICMDYESMISLQQNHHPLFLKVHLSFLIYKSN